MKLNENPFERIKNGTKTVEFRLFDEKRQKIKVGDKIEFSKLPDLQEKLLVDVVEVYREDTFEDLFRKLYSNHPKILFQNLIYLCSIIVYRRVLILVQFLLLLHL